MMAEDIRLVLRSELIKLHAREHWSVFCEAGEAWITLSGCSEDIVLRAHQRAELGPGDVLVEGHGQLRIRPRAGWLYRQCSRLMLVLWQAVRRQRRRKIRALRISTLRKISDG